MMQNKTRKTRKTELEDSQEEEQEEPPKDQRSIDEIVKKRVSEITKVKNTAKQEAEIAKKQKAEIERLAQKALKDISGTEEDVIEALTKLAAENEGLTVEEYKRKLQDEQLLEEYKRSRVTEEAQKAKAQHLAEIKNRFPDVEAQSHRTVA